MIDERKALKQKKNISEHKKNSIRQKDKEVKRNWRCDRTQYIQGGPAKVRPTYSFDGNI